MIFLKEMPGLIYYWKFVKCLLTPPISQFSLTYTFVDRTRWAKRWHINKCNTICSRKKIIIIKGPLSMEFFKIGLKKNINQLSSCQKLSSEKCTLCSSQWQICGNAKNNVIVVRSHSDRENNVVPLISVFDKYSLPKINDHILPQEHKTL